MTYFTAISNFQIVEDLVTWFIPPELSHCILSFVYSLKFTGIEDSLPSDARSLKFDKFNLSTVCKVDILTISPVLSVMDVAEHLISASAIVFTGSNYPCY